MLRNSRTGWAHPWWRWGGTCSRRPGHFGKTWGVWWAGSGGTCHGSRRRGRQQWCTSSVRREVGDKVGKSGSGGAGLAKKIGSEGAGAAPPDAEGRKLARGPTPADLRPSSPRRPLWAGSQLWNPPQPKFLRWFYFRLNLYCGWKESVTLPI